MAADTERPVTKRDQLLADYLDTLDLYEQQRETLHATLKDGYLHLAEANYYARPGMRYGRDFYDERMVATRGLRVTEGEDGEIMVKGRGIQDEDQETREGQGKGDEEGQVKEEKAGETEGLRRRRGRDETAAEGQEGEGAADKTEDKKDEDKKEVVTEEKPKQKKPRDPLRWYGVLVPPALRSAQSSFISATDSIYPLLATWQKLQAMADELGRTQDLFKIFTVDPSTAADLPETELDKESGYVHLCTGSQVVKVVSLFMAECEDLWAVRVPQEALEGGELRWEDGFPHFYGKLLKSMGREVGHLRKSEQGWEYSWDRAEWQHI